MYATADGHSPIHRPLPAVSRRRRSTATVLRPERVAPRHRHLSGQPTTRPTRLHRCADRRGEGGINFFDTAINYREPALGARYRRGAEAAAARRDRGLHQGRISHSRRGARLPEARATWWAACTRWRPDFLADQIDRSRANLGVDTIDVFYLHNPETQLGFVHARRIRSAHPAARSRGWKQLVEQEKIRWYGAATWDGFRKKGALEPAAHGGDRRGATAAPDHHFRFVQLPFNLGMVEAFVDRPESVLQAAARLGIAVVASATLLADAACWTHMPDAVAGRAAGPRRRTRSARFSSRARRRGSRWRWSGWAGASTCWRTSASRGCRPVTRGQYLRLYQ